MWFNIQTALSFKASLLSPGGYVSSSGPLATEEASRG